MTQSVVQVLHVGLVASHEHNVHVYVCKTDARTHVIYAAVRSHMHI